jgi:toxin ParE1/3/4
MRCEFSARAEADLESIGDYIAQDNPARALSFFQEIRQCCQNMAAQPLAAPLRPEYGEGIRRMPFGRYLIFYSVGDQSILIEHVRHSARKPEKLG